jgi:hypothetical protein
MKIHGDTANYIADMILELRNLAKAQQMTTLQGLLEIAYYEAYGTANQVHIPEEEFALVYSLGEDARRANVG